MLNKNRFFFVFRFTVSFGLLFILIWIMRKDINQVMNILKNVHKGYFMLGFLLSISLSILLAFRLRFLFLGQKIYLPIHDLFYLTFIGFFFNNFLPTAIGGDIAKAYYASKKTQNKPATYAAILLDRFCGVTAILSIALFGLLIIGKELQNVNFIWNILGMATLLFVAILFLLFKKTSIARVVFPKSRILEKVWEKISKLRIAINMYRQTPGLLIKAVLFSLLGQIGTIMGIYFFVLSLGGDMHFLKLFLIIPVVWAVSLVPSLGGLGVREGAFVYLLKGYIGADRAFATTILWLSVIILYSIVGGIFHLIYPVIHPIRKTGG